MSSSKQMDVVKEKKSNSSNTLNECRDPEEVLSEFFTLVDSSVEMSISIKNQELGLELINCLKKDFEEFKKKEVLPLSYRHEICWWYMKLYKHYLKHRATDPERRDLYVFLLNSALEKFGNIDEDLISLGMKNVFS